MYSNDITGTQQRVNTVSTVFHSTSSIVTVVGCPCDNQRSSPHRELELIKKPHWKYQFNKSRLQAYLAYLNS